ncbi:putative leucine-rich repeat-containing protein DDB_G0290503 [Daphnia carinata]|uniref:putative leucine-rich repeat-containing protein DDB_G0290503 n=1 Tax=Daphnia carinata TaxID=120202 RepID=UPI00257D870A|nr:putative leucine-rich repeat-containing protein DDB_G0290503 [Daphnia carinata]
MDASKAEKLAAAKKKLKQFQQKGGSKGTPNGGQLNLHQQGEVNQSSAVETNILHNEPVESKASLEIQQEEKHSYDNTRNIELQQVIETLSKEKNDILLSYMQSKDLVEELQLKLNQERVLLQEEKAKSTQALETISTQSLHEEELKNTVSILIEEKNELVLANVRSEEKIKKLEDVKVDNEKELEVVKMSLSLLQSSAAKETAELQSYLSTLTKDHERVSQELNLKDQLYNEVNEELKELQMRQNNQAAELNRRENIINELNLQIELLNVNMQQLKNAGPPTVDQSLEKMQKENDKLQEEIVDLREQLKTLNVEKDVLSQQYQQYILRLNGQIRTISSQAESLAIEKRNVEATLETKKDELAELEATIVALKMEQNTGPLSRTSNELATPSEILPSPQSASQLDEEIVVLKTQIAELSLNNEELVKLALEKESRIQELEIRIDRMQSELNVATTNQDHGEREKLLQAMQSDKSTASRAIAQNRQLKLQLEELEKAFIQLSNDKLVLTEESQTMARQNKEMSEKLLILEPEVVQLRQQVDDLAGQRNATIYWRQELEEAHERIQALSHQNAELKKRVIWNLNQAPARGSRKQRRNNEEINEDRSDSPSSSENEGDSDWIPAEEHQKLLFHFGQLEQRLERSIATVSTLTEEKQKLEHLVLQLQSETETIGEYVSLYQVQRGLLSRRAEQLSAERQKLKERILKLTILLPCLAPQLKNSPEWLQLQPEPETIANSEDGLSVTIRNETEALSDVDPTLEHTVSQIIDVLLEITNCTLPTSETLTQTDLYPLEDRIRKPNENFHPCWPMYSGRIINI